MDPQQRHLLEAVHTLALAPIARPAFAAAAGLPGWGADSRMHDCCTSHVHVTAHTPDVL